MIHKSRRAFAQDSADATMRDYPLHGLRETANKAQESLLASAQTMTNYTELFFSLCVVADSLVSLLHSMFRIRHRTKR